MQMLELQTNNSSEALLKGVGEEEGGGASHLAVLE